jgi:signal transduction histidine kinase
MEVESNHSLLLARDGSRIEIADRAAPVRDHSGNISAVMLVLSDQSKQKKREKRLREAREAAESAQRVREEFLANMSHEIRTPLNGIMGILQLLQTTDVDAEQNEYINMSITSTKRLGKLLTDILDLCMLEEGKLEIKKERFLVQDVLKSIQEMFNCELAKKGLDYQCLCAPDLPEELVGDETRLTQVLFNLLGNAIKYTNSGEIRFEAQVKAQKEQSCELLFVVSDTGKGIPDELQEHIFDLFTQANETDSPYSRKYEGAGLGIPLVKRLVKLMGGSVFLESQRSRGTFAYVLLPFGLPEREDSLGQDRQSQD